MCGTQEKVIVFTNSEAVVGKLNRCLVHGVDIAEIANQSPYTSLYELNNKVLACKALILTNLNVWHKRLAHPNVKVLNSLCETSHDVPCMKGKLNIGHPCIMGKATEKLFDSMFEPENYCE